MNEEKAADIIAFDWSTLPELLQEKGVDLSIDLGIKVATALAIFLIGKFVIGLVVTGVAAVMQKQAVDKTLETFICNLVRTTLMIVVVIAAIGAMGVETTSFIAIFGAAGLAVGLALQGSLSNFASGVLIVYLTRRDVFGFKQSCFIKCYSCVHIVHLHTISFE